MYGNGATGGISDGRAYNVNCYTITSFFDPSEPRQWTYNPLGPATSAISNCFYDKNIIVGRYGETEGIRNNDC